MIYQLKFMYDDNKEVNVTMKEEELSKFYKCLSEKSMYFDKDCNLGFWTDLDKVRYVQAQRMAPKEDEKPVHEVDAIPESAEVQSS